MNKEINHIEILKSALSTSLDVSSGEAQLKSLIGGKPVSGKSELESRISPATGSKIFSWQGVSSSEVDEAVSIARHCLISSDWAKSTGRDRSRILRRASQIMETRCESIAQVITLETGKPIRESRGEVAAMVNLLDYFAGLARDINGRTMRDIDPGLFSMTLREPVGVVAIIVPWNFPLAILGQKLPAALAAGCSVVIKPSPLTPISSLLTAEILIEAGLNPQVISVLLGDAALGGELVSHIDVDAITFTGSTETARRIAAVASSKRLKRLALEAGGKTPMVVSTNADIDKAVRGIIFAAYFNQGEVCVAGSRILVHKSVVEKFTKKFITAVNKIVLGDPFNENTQLGSVISIPHLESLLASVKNSVEQGAILISGGNDKSAITPGKLPIFEPTVLFTESDSNPASSEEFFGPITTIQPYSSDAELVSRLNSSRYGLGAAIWSENMTEAFNLTLAINTGTVWINSSVESFPEMPLGGRRDSGFSPEVGREGMEFFTSLKTVHLRLANSPGV